MFMHTCPIFFFKQKTAYEIMPSLVGSEMCIRDSSPTVYRYIDWLITVPLQMIEFYLILVAVRKANSGIFWRLLIGSLVMLIGGYLGEAGYINATLGFVIGMAGWVYILYEIFSGEAGKAASKSGNKALVTAFGAMRMIVTVGLSLIHI